MNAREKYRRAYQNARMGYGMVAISVGLDPTFAAAFTSYNMRMDARFRGWVSDRVRTWDYHQQIAQRRRMEKRMKELSVYRSPMRLGDKRMTYTNSFQQYKQIVDRINAAVEREATRQENEQIDAHGEMLDYLESYRAICAYAKLGISTIKARPRGVSIDIFHKAFSTWHTTQKKS